MSGEAWRCAAHGTVNTGDCPACDQEQIEALERYARLPVCRRCDRTLEVGEYAWADDVKVVEPEGVRLEIRYTCDRCEESRGEVQP